MTIQTITPFIIINTIRNIIKIKKHFRHDNLYQHYPLLNSQQYTFSKITLMDKYI